LGGSARRPPRAGR